MDGAELTAAAVRERLAPLADPEDAVHMAAYMKDHFPFFGIKAGPRRAAVKPILAASARATADELIDFALACWEEPEREFQHVAVDVLRKRSGQLEPDQLEELETLITTKSWWDTVDGLAAWVVGPMVRTHPDLVHLMDDWAEDDDMWLARTAMLHQLGYKTETDVERLFRYAEDLAPHSDFFIRKAIGWALRQYARTDPDAVRAFVSAHEADLSGLTRREALKHL
jgi:3-methyladenine DNA glycosylase AlkD